MSSLISSLLSEPSPFTIVELTGEANNLTLEGRCLPYRPVSFEGAMRAEFTWYPGNPIATVQMLGAEEKSTTINGMWKDRFIRTFTDMGLPVLEGRTGEAKFNGVVVDDVRSLCRIIEGFRLRGQLLEVGWDELTRQGILVRFKQTWLRREDVEWEMEFQWISRGEPLTPVAFGVDIPQLDIASQILSAIDALKSALEAPFALVTQITSAITDSMEAIVTAGDALSDVAKKAEAAITSPIEATRSTLAAVQTIKREAKSISDRLQSLPARAMRNVASLTDVSQGQALEAERYKRQARKAARKLRALAAQREQELAAQTIRQPSLQTVIAREGQDLRDISSQAYGTPNEWRRIASYNNLKSSRLSAGTIVLVPPLNRPGS